MLRIHEGKIGAGGNESNIGAGTMADNMGAPRILRLLNKDVIERLIRENGPVTKADIARDTNLSMVTINKTVEILLKESKIKVSGSSELSGGKRGLSYEINKEVNYHIALLYHRNYLLGVVANAAGNKIYEEEFPVRTEEYQQVAADMFAAIDALLTHCAYHEVTAIGVGVPGVVNGGFVTNIPNIPGLEGINVAELIEKKYGIRVFLENDINLATMGIYSDDYAAEMDNLLVIYMDQGIGSGIILNRELFKGSSNFAGELSYMPVLEHSAAEGEKRRYKGRLENEIAYITEAMNSGKEKEKWKKLLLKTLCDSLLSIICIINPETIVIQYEELEETDMRKLEEMLGQYIDEENVPNLVKTMDLKCHSIRGIINMCVGRIPAVLL